MMVQPYDLPLEQLRVYKPELTKQPDFESFWEQTLAELVEVPLQYERTPYHYPVKGLKVYRMLYGGFNNARIETWLALPESSEPLPGIVNFHGYGYAHDNRIHETVNLALKGYAVLTMLCRGQQGESVDNVIATAGHVTGWMTKGIQNPSEYYYRAVYMDAVRALEVLQALPEVDGSRIAVMGESQGGALALASAALSHIPKLVLSEFPYLSHFERAIDLTALGPYGELNEYFRRYVSFPEIEEKAKHTLSYFDVMNLASRIQCHTWTCVGLIDQVTPPSTVFAAYNHLNCSKEIEVYRYYGHEIIPGTVIPRLQLLLDYLQNK